MDIETRQSTILDLVRDSGSVGVDTLADHFGLSTQTIRADLRDLDARGLLERIHGGARRVETVTNRDHAERRRLHGTAKAAIAAATARLIPDACSVSINIGTTTEQVAEALRGHRDLVVVTNNINIVNTLIDTRMRDVVLVGGSVRPSDGAVVGEDAVTFLSRYKTDIAVIGASALDADGAILDFDAREVSVARAILKNARRRILVADSSKFDLTAPVRICDISELDTIVTDAPPPAEFLETARAGGTEILIAGETS